MSEMASVGPKRMRVILVEPNGHQGHAAFVDSLARVLRRRYRVVIVTRARTGVGWCVPALRIHTTSRVLLYWKIFLCLSKLARSGDVIHFQNVSAPIAMVAVLLHLTKRGTELADTVHNVEPHSATMRQVLDCKLQRALVRLGLFRDVYVLSGTSLAYGPGLTRMLGPGFRVVHHQFFAGRQSAKHCMALRRQKRRLGRPLKVLCFGVVRKDKGLKEFLAAASSAGGLHIELRVMGTFPDYDPTELREYVGAVSNLTVMPGFASEQAKSEAFEWCDFCLLSHLPSYKVGSGVLVDACERATPAIAVSGSSVAANVKLEGCGVVLPRREPERWQMLLVGASAQAVYDGFLDAIDRVIQDGWGNDDIVAAGYNYRRDSTVWSARKPGTRGLNLP